MEVLFSILAFLIVLTPVVFFHELGHYWAARRCGVTVDVFSVGFGSEIFGYTDRNGTQWKFSAIPLGGYVMMAGDMGVASNPSDGAAAMPGSFHGASLGARSFIIAMGPIANFILGIAVITGVYIGFGKVEIPNIIGQVIPGSPAAEAGLREGDRVLAIDGAAIRDFNAMRGHVYENPGSNLLFTIDRDGRQIDLGVTPRTINDECLGITYGQIGAHSATGTRERYWPSEAVLHASRDSFTLALGMLRGLGRLVSGNANKGEIGGPVKIAELSGRVASQGFINFLMFAAIISINLGLVNLLPVPALDGGHLMFFGLEKLMGRPLPVAVQDIIMRVGMALLLGLILVLTAFDFLGLFGKQC